MKHSLYHTDIKQDGFIDRYCPVSLIPYLKLGRFDRPVGVWLTVLPGFWALSFAGDNPLPIAYLIIFILGGFAVRAAGCTINDIWDRDLDKKVERTALRPLASGRLNIFQALSFLFFCLSVAFAALLFLPFSAIIIGIFALIPIAIYPLMKRITFWPQLFLGLVFNLSILIGWLCQAPEITPAAILMYIAAIFFTIGYDTIYAFQDIDDDLKVGIKSTAIKFQTRPKLFVGLCYATGFLLLSLSTQTWLIVFGGLHLIWQIYSWEVSSRPSSLKIFKSNVWFQTLIWLALILLGI